MAIPNINHVLVNFVDREQTGVEHRAGLRFTPEGLAARQRQVGWSGVRLLIACNYNDVINIDNYDKRRMWT